MKDGIKKIYSVEYRVMNEYGVKDVEYYTVSSDIQKVLEFVLEDIVVDKKKIKELKRDADISDNQILILGTLTGSNNGFQYEEIYDLVINDTGYKDPKNIRLKSIIFLSPKEIETMDCKELKKRLMIDYIEPIDVDEWYRKYKLGL